MCNSIYNLSSFWHNGICPWYYPWYNCWYNGTCSWCSPWYNGTCLSFLQNNAGATGPRSFIRGEGVPPPVKQVGGIKKFLKSCTFNEWWPQMCFSVTHPPNISNALGENTNVWFFCVFAFWKICVFFCFLNVFFFWPLVKNFFDYETNFILARSLCVWVYIFFVISAFFFQQFGYFHAKWKIPQRRWILF